MTLNLTEADAATNLLYYLAGGTKPYGVAITSDQAHEAATALLAAAEKRYGCRTQVDVDRLRTVLNELAVMRTPVEQVEKVTMVWHKQPQGSSDTAPCGQRLIRVEGVMHDHNGSDAAVLSLGDEIKAGVAACADCLTMLRDDLEVATASGKGF